MCLWSIRFTEKEDFIFEKIAAAADQLNVTAYLIGGFVRDRIIGRPTKKMRISCVVGDGIELAHAHGIPVSPRPAVSYFKKFLERHK